MFDPDLDLDDARGYWSRQRVGDGYLVSLDRGGGGGLWWVSASGDVNAIIENRPVWRVGHSVFGPYALVLDDLGESGEIGALVTLARDANGSWKVARRFRFEGVVLQAQDAREDGVFIVTASQFVRWSGADIHVLVDALEPQVMVAVGPFSVSRAEEWIYLGMRLLLLRVGESGGQVEWYVPRRCVGLVGAPFNPAWCKCRG